MLAVLVTYLFSSHPFPFCSRLIHSVFYFKCINSCPFGLPLFKCQMKITYLLKECHENSHISCSKWVKTVDFYGCFSQRLPLGPVFKYLKIIRINWITEKSPILCCIVIICYECSPIDFLVLTPCGFYNSAFPQTSVTGSICLMAQK